MAAPPPAGHRARACAISTTIWSPATPIDGPWSDPVHLNSSGFDPSLFHDDDGRKYLVNQLWDHRPGRNRFAGIVLQEYSPNQQRLVGERKNIFEGTPLGLTEAPHLYKRDGWYYLITAEGGTGWNHAVTMARSRDLRWPLRAASRHLRPEQPRPPDAPLQRAGHADLVETPTARPTWSICAAARCPIAAAACWAARRRSSRWLGRGRLARTLDG
jgi:xylan 1,4-beta-xylosidase